MSANGHGRRDVDEVIVAALVSGATYSEAAELAGVSRSTVRRRMANPSFRARVHDQRMELVSALRGRVMAAAPAAVETLVTLQDGAESETVRLAAAREVLTVALSRRPGIDYLSGQELRSVFDRFLSLALKQIPEDRHYEFISAVAAFADGQP